MRSTAMIGAVLALALLWAESADAQTRATRYYATSRYVLTFETDDKIPIQTVSGGSVRGEVVLATTATGSLSKHIARTVVVPLTFESDLVATLRQWVADSLNQPGVNPRPAELLLVNQDLQVESVRLLVGAVVSKVTFPALDAGDTGPANVSIELRPQSVTERRGDRSKVSLGSKTKATQPLAANFKLEIDGLPTDRVRRIEPLTWTLAPAPSQAGRDYRTAPMATTASIGDLRLTIHATDYDPWFKWFEDFVLKGNNSMDRERSGTLTLLAPDLQQPLLVIELHGLGIYALDRVPATADADSVAAFVAEMYVQRIAIQPQSGAVR